MTEDISCPFCKGPMEIMKQHRHNRGVAVTVIIIGFLSFFTMNILLGVLLLIVGLFMAFSEKEYWHCQACNSAIERLKN